MGRRTMVALGAFLLTMGTMGLAGTAALPEVQEERLFALVFTTGPAWDASRSPGEQAYMAEHSRNLFRLRDEGRIAFGGRFGPYGLVVVRAVDEAGARGLVEPDPSVRNGTFEVEIHPWSTIFEGSVVR